METETLIRKYLKERFVDYDDGIRIDDTLEGVVDSLGLFDLVGFLEVEFGIYIPNEEFSPQRFSSINKILTTIEEFKV